MFAGCKIEQFEQFHTEIRIQYLSHNQYDQNRIEFHQKIEKYKI